MNKYEKFNEEKMREELKKCIPDVTQVALKEMTLMSRLIVDEIMNGDRKDSVVYEGINVECVGVLRKKGFVRTRIMLLFKLDNHVVRVEVAGRKHSLQDDLYQGKMLIYKL